jgi:hypothetical protein
VHIVLSGSNVLQSGTTPVDFVALAVVVPAMAIISVKAASDNLIFFITSAVLVKTVNFWFVLPTLFQVFGFPLLTRKFFY